MIATVSYLIPRGVFLLTFITNIMASSPGLPLERRRGRPGDEAKTKIQPWV